MNKVIIESMRRILLRRIVENLKEADVYDDRGNIIISKDLKVRHIPSQFEYTVADIIQGPDEEVSFVLRAPEGARFTPSGFTDGVEGEGKMVISKDEFEKEYEVK
jgi:hypothetical protein|tara:strand:+ start:349 stop:663 length:315 start_codon:yes stop_codon:yes gene_type:complete